MWKILRSIVDTIFMGTAVMTFLVIMVIITLMLCALSLEIIHWLWGIL